MSGQPGDGQRRARIEWVRREIAEHADEYPEPSDEQIRVIAALLPPVRSIGAEQGGGHVGTP